MQPTFPASRPVMVPLSIACGLLLTAALFLFVLSYSPAPASAAGGDSYDWLFDRSYYTDKPKSNRRTWQYAPDPTPIRDPYSVVDSSMSSYPFEPGDYGPNPTYYNPYYAPSMYPGAPGANGLNYGWNVNNYYPYDGQPINTD
jgi:hypothetical protein